MVPLFKSLSTTTTATTPSSAKDTEPYDVHSSSLRLLQLLEPLVLFSPADLLVSGPPLRKSNEICISIFEHFECSRNGSSFSIFVIISISSSVILLLLSQRISLLLLINTCLPLLIPYNRSCILIIARVAMLLPPLWRPNPFFPSCLKMMPILYCFPPLFLISSSQKPLWIDSALF